MKKDIVIPAAVIIILLVGLSFLIFRPSTSQESQTDLYSQNETIKDNADQTLNTMKPNESTPPPMTIDEEKQYLAVLKTSEGDITIQLNADTNPITVNNFVNLAESGFYDDTIFHRVIKGFMIQGGDPQGTGAGGPGYRFDDEAFEGEYTRGTVAMANAGPNTNGSQFFIMHEDYDLPKNYVIFGKVTKGLEVVDKIAESEVSTNAFGEASTPVNPVKVESVEITEK